MIQESVQLDCHLKPYIKPFEKVLALKELKALIGVLDSSVVLESNQLNRYVIQSTTSKDQLIKSLAYWEGICKVTDNRVELTKQVRREATTAIIRKSDHPLDLRDLLPFSDNVPQVKRRNLRYGPHGLHEYRGKFFPQLARSLLNVASANEQAKVLDPMCGSGTTLVETVLNGGQAFGIDMNPLSVLISQVKCKSLALKPQLLEKEYLEHRNRILSGGGSKKERKKKWVATLPIQDIEYLRKWFAPRILNELEDIVFIIQKTKNIISRDVFKVILSNILRKVSWQKIEDLRVRKEVFDDIEINVVKEYICELDKSVSTILAFSYENEGHKVGKVRTINGDAKLADKILKSHQGTFDTIITSPPYATALPYLDTDRLSLYFLGLLSRGSHRSLDKLMVGNREINNQLRKQYWNYYQANRSLLTKDICELIDHIYESNERNEVGFRRKNLPGLLAKYFFDMRIVMSTYLPLLKTGAPAFMVVGNNHTNSGGKRIEIKTDDLLGELGKSVGLSFEEKLPMDMLVSRDIFRKNTGSAESILFFRNP